MGFVSGNAKEWELVKEYKDAERMYRKIILSVDRDSPAQCEKLHSWDGKRSGLGLALQIFHIPIPQDAKQTEVADR